MVGDRAADFLAGFDNPLEEIVAARVDVDQALQRDRLQPGLRAAYWDEPHRPNNGGQLTGLNLASDQLRQAVPKQLPTVERVDSDAPLLGWVDPDARLWGCVGGADRDHVTVGDDFGDHRKVTPPDRVEAVVDGDRVEQLADLFGDIDGVDSGGGDQVPDAHQGVDGGIHAGEIDQGDRSRNMTQVDFGPAAVKRRHGAAKDLGREVGLDAEPGLDVHGSEVHLGDRGGTVSGGRPQLDGMGSVLGCHRL